MAQPERRRSYVLVGAGLLAAAGFAYLSGHKSPTPGSTARNDEVDVSVSGSGTVLANGQTAPAKLVEPDGTTVHFQAMPAAGWTFSHWQGTGGSSTANPLVVTLNTASGQLEAVFYRATGCWVDWTVDERLTLVLGDSWDDIAARYGRDCMLELYAWFQPYRAAGAIAKAAGPGQ